jgi:hypothetical protein
MDRYRQRADAYRSKRPGATTNDEWQMVIPAWIRYERRLVAMSADPRAPSLAFEYVSNLRPCYEWEGLPECPEREAKFADAYHASHPQGPFSHYLPLLSAHRWLCAAEAYETANDQAALASSRRLYEQRLAAARTSTSLLVRAAADELAARGRCLPER